MRSFLATAGIAALLMCLAHCNREESSKKASSAAMPEKEARPERREARDDETADPKVALREAFDAAKATVEPEEREKALAAVAWDGIDVDPELAREAFAALDPGGESAKRLVGHFAMRLADDDPDAAMEWARSLEQTGEREEAVGRIAVVLADADPERAATLVAEELPPGIARDRVVVQVVQRWAQSAPVDAAGWVATFPAGEARSAGFTAVATAWLASDPTAYEGWVLDSSRAGLAKEGAAAAATALRALPDATRSRQLAAFKDREFRAAVENLLEKKGR